MINHEVLNLFDELYHQTYQDILKYVICNCSNIDDVKDIVQNTYLDILKKIQDGKPFPQNRSYILGIAKNKIKDYYRFRYKDKLLSFFSNSEDFKPLDNIPSEIDIEQEFIKVEDVKAIWHFLKNKKVIICKIFYLYYYSNFSIKEIAEELHIGQSSVKNYLYRTLKELNAYFEKEERKNV